MRVPLSWLSEFTPLGVDASDAAGVAALGAELDSLGLVVEGVDRVAIMRHGIEDLRTLVENDVRFLTGV